MIQATKILGLVLLFALLGWSQPSAAGGAQARYIDVTIAQSASLSSAAVLGACTPVGIEVAIQALAGWTAASLTLQASIDGTNYYNVWDEFGSEVTLSVNSAANTAPVRVRLSPADYWGIHSIKLRSGTSGTPVVQTAARTLRIVCR